MDIMGKILNTHIEEDIFSLEYMEFKIKKLPNGNARDIKLYQDEILKMGKSIFIPHVHNLLNLELKHNFSNLLK